MAKAPYGTAGPSMCRGATPRVSATVGGTALLAVVALLAGRLACLLAAGRARSVSPLDLPLLPTGPRQSLPLQKALSALGQSPREGFVLFGLEERLRDGKEPTVDVHIGADATLGVALREVIAQLPPYEMEAVSDHLIDLRPKGAREDPDNILNLRVPTFDTASTAAYGILDAPRDFIPELNQALRPEPEPGKQVIELYFGGYHGGPPVTLHLKNVTVRDILNAASVATEQSYGDHKPDAPRGWTFAFDPNPPSGKSKYSWRSFLCLPSYWHLGVREGEKPPKR